MNISELSIQQLKKAVALKERISKLEAELASLTGASSKAPAAKKRKGMSAAGRARVAAAQKKRWAKIKGKTKTKPAKKKGKMSAAGRAAIVAAQKARWVKIKAAKKA